MARLRAHLTLRLSGLPLLVLLTGCAASLGPGFALREERVRVSVQPAGAIAVSVQTTGIVKDIGIAPLDSLAFQAGRGARRTLQFQPPLAPRKSRPFSLGFSVPASGPDIWLDSAAWFPAAIPPAGMFARGEPFAETTRIQVRVPGGYRVLTGGEFRGVGASAGGETEYRFELRPRGFAPFLLVGRYEELRVRAAGENVIFWTHAPLDAGCARSLAPPLSATMQFYRSAFGPPSRQRLPLRVIQVSPAALANEPDGIQASSVPAGALVTISPADWCSKRESFLAIVDHELARTWFGWAVRPEPGAEAVLDMGASEYAALLDAQRLSKAAREGQLSALLTEFDNLRKRSLPLPPVALDSHSTGDQRRMAGIQSALCLVALENRVGASPVERALAHLVRSERGRSASLDELRSAVEQETGQDLYAFFRDWLRRAGIPASFRASIQSARRKRISTSDPIRDSRRTP